MCGSIEETYDVIVVGAGHAGCEAALACARMGLSTVIFTLSADNIAMMPCNPNIGGSSKGHLVCELDALGGQMGKTIDKTFIQSKLLNISKGPAVHSLRAQADKMAYSLSMRKTLENTPYLSIKQTEVKDILVSKFGRNMMDSKEQEGTELIDLAKSGKEIENHGETQNENSKECKEDLKGVGRVNKIGNVEGVSTVSGAIYHAKKVILCTGVYLKARCIYGEVIENTGPNGLKAATYLTASLIKLGIPVRRFKTGTPARVDSRSVDFSKMEVQKGDGFIRPFSFSHDYLEIKDGQADCFLTYTNEATHKIIRDNLSRSPLFSGNIKGIGPRYCPSIEDKVVKFPDKQHHQIFVEPEGLYTNEVYLSGMSSSMPEDVQYAMIRTMPGFEHAHIVRNAYAIEYDCIDATSLKATLESKTIQGLYAAGQINGSSGYEEAAVQGFMAGVNAALSIKGKDEIVLDRSQAYIGVLIDDLVTKESIEPYRMMTSRAEYRLLLRQDNADLRLRDIGRQIGLVSDEEYLKFLKKKEDITREIERMNKKIASPNDKVNKFLIAHGSSPLSNDHGVSFSSLIKRPELDYDMVGEIDDERKELSWRVREQVNIQIKYEGYILKQRQQVEQFKKIEGRKLPKDLDYLNMEGLRLEARQKLDKIRPDNLGQAGRISGVSPSDINVLLVYLEKYKAKTRESNNCEKPVLG